MSTPVFVTGIGRSGTSAVLKSLAEHPLFEASSAFGEAPFVAAFMQFLRDYENGPQADYHLKNYKVDPKRRARILGNMLANLHVAEPDPARRKPFWTSKISFREEAAPKFDELFPRLGVIYIIRNGIEVVHSSRNFAGFSAMDFEALCNRWRASLRANRFLETRGDCAMVRHGDMVRDPEGTFARVFERLQVPYDDGPARFIGGTVFNSSFGGLKARQVERGASSKEMSERLLSAWNAWTAQERATFTERCGAEMARYGFAVPGEREGEAWTQPEATSHVGRAGDAATRARVAAARVKRKPAEYEPVEPVEDPQRAGAITVPAAVIERRAIGDGVPILRTIEKRIGLPIASYGTHPARAAGCLYVETPKVACTTIKYLVQNAELEALGKPIRPFDRQEIHRRTDSPLPAIRHMKDAEARAVLQTEDLFRFAIVRNPFERALSCYLSKVVPPMPQRVQLIAQADGIKAARARDDGREITFRRFLELVAEQDVRHMDGHWRPQVDQILVGLVRYDFIGDFARFREALGYVKHRCFPESKVELPAATNRTGAGRAVREHYDEGCADLVRRIYREDFEAFGYATELPG